MGVGMRFVRPLEAAVDDEEQAARLGGRRRRRCRRDVKARLKEGRGALGIADQTLPAAVEAAEKLTRRQVNDTLHSGRA